MTTRIGEAARQFHAPRTMTPDELGDSLAHLVWESFSDFVAGSEPDFGLRHLLAASGAEALEQQALEEALVFVMWAHTRGAQLAFIGRTPERLLRLALDLMHRAVFDDMAFHGAPRSQLPIFEQRVAARYAEYAAAAEVSNGRLARAVVRHLTGSELVPDLGVRVVVERAMAVVGPLKDFLEDVDLTD